MVEQFSLPGFESPEHLEVAFLNRLFPELKAAIENCGGDPENVTFTCRTGYTAVFFKNITAFRLHLRGKQHFILLPTFFSDLLPHTFPVKQVSSDPQYVRILIDKDHPVDYYHDFLIKIAGETVNRYPKEWDCCSRYLECSDAKTCIHPDISFALGCGYRRILNSGRIFYGKNRNVD